MPDNHTTEAFFRPDALMCQRITIPADIYNLCRLTLAESAGDYCLVPIRSMQYLAVIANEEILFVDSQAYVVRNGEGGRLIVLSWLTTHTGERASLNAPVPVEVVYYKVDGQEIQARLLNEFRKALQSMQRHTKTPASVKQHARVVRLPGK